MQYNTEGTFRKLHQGMFVSRLEEEIFSRVRGASLCRSLVCELVLQYYSSIPQATGKKDDTRNIKENFGYRIGLEKVKQELEEEFEKETKMVICACGSVALKVTAWTDNNLGWSFWSCARNGSNCGFIGWADDPMCPRAVRIIPGLLRSKNNVYKKLKKAKSDLAQSGFLQIHPRFDRSGDPSVFWKTGPRFTQSFRVLAIPSAFWA
ncbi:hypothetical protein LXL04_033461 [Taraxacum kok-saghyz]